MSDTMQGKSAPSPLAELLRQATQRASDSICRWTGGSVALSLGAVEELPPEVALNRLELGDELLTFVGIEITGAESGQILLAFDDDNVQRLTSALLSRGEDAPPSEELCNSALQETANILGSAYLSVLSDATDTLL
ncbi:MAG: chemotaxis protein CheX, partial [Planctomycetales bacterium]|nr:chemotaxis protein CheX [Planctomycetales bacterium]